MCQPPRYVRLSCRNAGPAACAPSGRLRPAGCFGSLHSSSARFHQGQSAWTTQQFDERRRHGRIEMLSAAGLDQRDNVVELQLLTIRAIMRQGIEEIGDSDNAACEWDFLSTQT